MVQGNVMVCIGTRKLNNLAGLQWERVLVAVCKGGGILPCTVLSNVESCAACTAL